jgi:elongation factor Ts
MSSANLVKQLRDISGAGMMDCKKALDEAKNDLKIAIEILRKNGIAKAQKKAGREAKEGMVVTYIHPGSKLGVLVEINCETDFVARTAGFNDFSKEVAMHIAAASPISVSIEDIPKDVIEKEKEIYKEQAIQAGKKEEFVDKIVEGRLNKFYQESVLLEQIFVKDPDKKIKDMITEIIAKLGENIVIKRFSRFNLVKKNQFSHQ